MAALNIGASDEQTSITRSLEVALEVRYQKHKKTAKKKAQPGPGTVPVLAVANGSRDDREQVRSAVSFSSHASGSSLFDDDRVCSGKDKKTSTRQQPRTKKKAGSIFLRYHGRSYPVWIKEILNGTTDVHAVTIKRLKVGLAFLKKRKSNHSNEYECLKERHQKIMKKRKLTKGHATTSDRSPT